MAAGEGRGGWWLFVPLLYFTSVAGRVDLYVSRPSENSRELSVACLVTMPTGSVHSIQVIEDSGGPDKLTLRNETTSHLGANVTSAFLLAFYTLDRCRDVHFRCEAIFMDNGNPDSERARTTFFQPPSQPPQLSATLSDNREVKAGDWLDLSCVGNSTSTEAEMTWEFLRKGEMTLSASKCEDCANRPMAGDGVCSHTLTSSLKYRVTAMDNGLRIRCVLRSTSQPDSRLTSDFVVSLQLQSEPDVTLYLASGCVIAVLVIIVVVLSFCVIRLVRSASVERLEFKKYRPSLSRLDSSSSSEISQEDKCHYSKVGEPVYVPMYPSVKPCSEARTEDTFPKVVTEECRALPPPLASQGIVTQVPPWNLEELCRNGVPQALENHYQNGASAV